MTKATITKEAEKVIKELKADAKMKPPFSIR